MSKNPEGRLSPKMEMMVKAQYRRYTRNTTDPFKRAVYCVVGSCDVNDEHKEVAQTADDYLWFKLSQISDEDNAETKGERMTYSHLQSIILEEYGESDEEQVCSQRKCINYFFVNRGSSLQSPRAASHLLPNVNFDWSV